MLMLQIGLGQARVERATRVAVIEEISFGRSKSGRITYAIKPRGSDGSVDGVTLKEERTSDASMVGEKRRARQLGNHVLR